MITFPILGHFTVLQGRAEAADPVSAADFLKYFFGAGVFGPIVENWLIVLVPYQLTRKRFGFRAFIISVMCVAVGLHFYFSSTSLISAAITFFGFGWQYDLWRRLRGGSVAFWGGVLTHGMLNSMLGASLICERIYQIVILGG